MNQSFLLFFLLLISFTTFSQEEDSIPEQQFNLEKDGKLIGGTIEEEESVVVKKEKKILKNYSPKKATLLSIIPGAGQIYNEIASPSKHSSWWKVPIIYGGLGACIYLAVDNKQMYDKYAHDFNLLTDTNAVGTPYFPLLTDPDVLETQAQSALTSYEYALVGGIVVYLLNIVDATIDANFINFDVSKDLSLNISPYGVIERRTPMIGLNLKLNIH